MIYLISMLELPNITPLTREPVKKREEKFKFHSNDIVCRSYTVYCSISFRSVLFCVVRYRGMFLIQTQCSVLLADIRMVFVCIFFEFLFFHLCVLFIRLFLFSCILLMDRIATFVAWLFVYFLVITRTPISFWFSFFGYCRFMIYINCLALICVCVRQIERQAIRYSCSFLFNFNCCFFFFHSFFFLLSFIHVHSFNSQESISQTPNFFQSLEFSS